MRARSSVGKALHAIHDWTFLLGPGFADGIGTGMILGWLMYRSGLVSRRMALFGVVGARSSPLRGSPCCMGSSRSPPRCRASRRSRRSSGRRSWACGSPSRGSGAAPILASHNRDQAIAPALRRRLTLARAPELVSGALRSPAEHRTGSPSPPWGRARKEAPHVRREDRHDPRQTQDARTIPRFALRTFWWLHRTTYRVSGGRLGLSRPETGAKFGMMRLTTLGRRSGQSRVAISATTRTGRTSSPWR